MFYFMSLSTFQVKLYCTRGIAISFVFFALFGFSCAASAATFQLTPSAGTFNSGERFTVNVAIDSEGISINSGEGVLNFDTRYLAVEKISKDTSIFKIWVQEPTFSNTAGTISFGGGLPSPGYNGPKGQVMKITLRGVGAGISGLTLDSGAILANDGIGTNVLRVSLVAQHQYKVNAAPLVGIPASIDTKVAPSTKIATSSTSTSSSTNLSISEPSRATSSPSFAFSSSLIVFVVLVFVGIVVSILL